MTTKFRLSSNKRSGMNASEFVKKYFTNPDKKLLPIQYAFFHMLRIYYWLVESKRDMYVTYGMFERITKFIHTLAFRMYLAVAQLLIDNYGLPDRV